MAEHQQPEAGPRRGLATLGWFALGALGAAAALLILEAALPGRLPYWVGYAMAAVCFGSVYVRIVRARLSQRTGRRSSREAG